jgi:hypothetical protein
MGVVEDFLAAVFPEATETHDLSEALDASENVGDGVRDPDEEFEASLLAERVGDVTGAAQTTLAATAANDLPQILGA